MATKTISISPRRQEKLLDNEQVQSYLREMSYKASDYLCFSDKDQKKVHELVKQLPQLEMVIIYLTYWKGLYDFEIARIVKKRANTVAKIRSDVLLKLKEQMEKKELAD